MKGKEPTPSKTKKVVDTKGRRLAKNIILILSIVLIVALVATQLFAFITGNEQLAAVGEGVTSVINPIQTSFTTGVNWVVDYLYTLKLRSTLETAYEEIKQENETLVYQAMLADELSTKLAVYEQLFDEVSLNESMNPLVATVIGRDSGNYFSVFTINKGSNDGIEEFMAVTVNGGLVGYTYNITPTTSDVRTIIDSEASIAGLISDTRDQGTVRGTLGIDGEAMCRMYYLPDSYLSRPGDVVVTSGVGMSFPKGIPIGTVRESTRGMESNKQYIVIEPTVDFQHIEYVVVLRYQPTAETVDYGSDDEIIYVELETDRPIPTIVIGSDFYQLAPTEVPEETPEPVAEPTTDADGNIIMVTPEVVETPEVNNYEYHAPTLDDSDDSSYGYTLAPTSTPTPTPQPLDLSVEED